MRYKRMQFFESDEYQPVAQQIYHQLSAKIKQAVPGAVVEHIGSSAIPGVISKGDLDIFVGVVPTDFNASVRILEDMGFIIKHGSLRTESLCPFEVHGYPLEVGVQLVALKSKFEFFRTFRDSLRREPALRQRYNELKLSCAGLDPQEYRHVKSAFIEAFLETRRED